MNKNDSPMNAGNPDAAAPDVQPCAERADSKKTKRALAKWLAGAGIGVGAGVVLMTTTTACMGAPLETRPRAMMDRPAAVHYDEATQPATQPATSNSKDGK